jgi:hypothetical protein
MACYSTDPGFNTSVVQIIPLPVAAELAEIVTEACHWFHDHKHIFLGNPEAPAFDDETVEEVCFALQHQLDREGRSRTKGHICVGHGVPHTDWYKVTDLPMSHKRALVERIWALKQEHGIISWKFRVSR